MTHNKLAAFALASAVALIVALPAAAESKEKPASREPQVSTALQPSSHLGAGKSSSHLQVHRHHAATKSTFSAAAYEECSFICGDWLVTCSGETADCDDSSCEATGGGFILDAECVD